MIHTFMRERSSVESFSFNMEKIGLLEDYP